MDKHEYIDKFVFTLALTNKNDKDSLFISGFPYYLFIVYYPPE